MSMTGLGSLRLVPALEAPELLASPVLAALRDRVPDEVHVAPIDAELADTAAFCAAYDVPPGASANCVVLAGRRGEVTTLAACVVLATTRVDVNGLARRTLDVRKVSFAPMDLATSQTAMEYGGITPIGLPADWPILVDAAVVAARPVVVGSGLRRSKIVLPGSALADLPGARVLDGLGLPVG